MLRSSWSSICKDQPFLLRLLLQQLDAAFERLLDLLRADRLEFKDGAAADDGVVDIKIRIFGGRSNQGDLTVLQKFQQGLLLFFVQVLNLVQIEHHAVHPFKGVQRGDDLLKIGGAGSGAIELVQFFARLLCDDAVPRWFFRCRAVRKRLGWLRDRTGRFGRGCRLWKECGFARPPRRWSAGAMRSANGAFIKCLLPP